jgi:hypothetical protein
MGDAGTADNVIQGNWIGTDRDGRLALGNGLEGIILISGASHNVIGKALDGSGDGNVIANSGAPGILVFDTDCTGNSLRANRIYDNAGLAIDLRGGTEDFRGVTANDPSDADAGPNGLQNYPVFTAARYGEGITTVSGTLNSAPGRIYILDFFRVSPTLSPHWDTLLYLGAFRVRTDASGNAGFATGFESLFLGDFVTATATDLTTGDTSEFSVNAGLTEAPPDWPIIVQPPYDTLASTGAVVSLSVAARGATPLRYQWRFNGVNIAGVTNTALILTNIQVSQSGRYSVLVSNAFGFAASPEASVTVLHRATTQPFFMTPFYAGETFSAQILGLQSGAIYRIQISSNLIQWADRFTFDGTPYADPRFTFTLLDGGMSPFLPPTVKRFYRIVSP